MTGAQSPGNLGRLIVKTNFVAPGNAQDVALSSAASFSGGSGTGKVRINFPGSSLLNSPNPTGNRGIYANQ